MVYNIFVLEDEIDRYPREQIKMALHGHNLTIARNVPEAKELFVGPYDLILLDHDMEGFYEKSDHPNTGYQFCKWLVDAKCSPKPQVILHSHNPVGRKNMRLLLEEYGFSVDEC